MAYKKCLIATTKNLFDISKATKLQNSSFKDAATDKYVIISNGYWTTLTSYQNGIYGTDVGVNLSAGTYTYSANVESELGKISIVIYTSSKVIYSGDNISVINNEVYRSFTLETDSTVYFGVVETGNSSHTSAKCTVTNIQLEKGSTATSYVPYGYLPSYKKLIKVSNVCQVLNKSKFPVTQTINDVTFTNNGDGTITANGTASAEAQLDLVSHSGETLSFSGLDVYSRLIYSGCPDGGSNSTYGIQNTWVRSDFTDNGNGGITNTTNTKYDGYYRFGYAIVIRQGYTANNLVFKPMCINLTEMYGAGHEPTTVAEFRQKFPNDYYDYSPSCWITSYQKNLITDGSSKNLFDIDSVSFFTKDSNGEYKSNKRIRESDILWKPTDGSKQVTISGYIKCPVGNKYMFMITYTDGTESYKNLESTGNYIYQAITSNSSKVISFIGLTYYDNSGQVYIKDVQIEYGSSATSYVPYQYL
uniref:Uncharacterized protein n=1 Tax=Siphoviridae sp. ctrpg19 TaxID=2826481 RepID=A0A8S5MJZ9_9CAUD|nr:MAG TPA: hypothetical protein [Siphoviridae sp. ctrpg19]